MVFFLFCSCYNTIMFFCYKNHSNHLNIISTYLGLHHNNISKYKVMEILEFTELQKKNVFLKTHICLPYFEPVLVWLPLQFEFNVYLGMFSLIPPNVAKHTEGEIICYY